MKLSDAIERAIALGVKQSFHEFISRNDDCACGLGAAAIGIVGTVEDTYFKWKLFCDTRVDSYSARYSEFFTTVLGVPLDDVTMHHVITLNDTYFASFPSIIDDLRKVGK